MYVIVAHTVGVIGPFPSEDEAIAYGKSHLIFSWYVRTIIQPQGEAQAA